MLLSTLVYKDIFSRLSHFDSLYSCMPNEKDWKVVKDICERFELFYNVYKLFSGTTYFTSNEYFLSGFELKITLSEVHIQMIRLGLWHKKCWINLITIGVLFMAFCVWQLP